MKTPIFYYKYIRVRIIRFFSLALADIRLFFRDLIWYLQRRLSFVGNSFETVKGFFVDILMAKRGKYHGSFLNVSLLFLVVSGILVAPYLSSYYPTLGASGEVLSSVAPPSATVAELNFDQMSMATAISDKPRDTVLDYSVQPGDTLSTIAGKFDVDEDTIKWANNLKGTNPVLKTDQVLKIPPVSGVVHSVKRGDTVYTIAEKYHTEAQNIVNFPFNDFVDLDNFTLAVGQSLIVPGGIIEEEKAPGAPIRAKAPEYLAKQTVGQLLWPTSGYISQQPVWYHMAIDVANKSAPDVFAAESGFVSLATCYGWGYGCHIIIDHGGGTSTLYAHLSSFYVSAGESVGQGQAIGRMGSTGRSTGTHLHFEVREGGAVQNPWNYFQ